MIHAQSGRKTQPWVTLNCPALSPQLMESELFGHKKGAFTGADYDRIGRFEAAAFGTLLLDEISEIDLNLQPKLLRVMQEHSFQQVGSNETIPSTARVLATTNRNLAQEVAEGRFREDLYYRLAILPIHVPSLRERKEDIPELFDYFLGQTAKRFRQTPPQWEPEVLELLFNYDWPGNVRQLEHLVTRIAVFGEGETVGVDDVRQWLEPLASGLAPSCPGVEFTQFPRESNAEYRRKGRVCSFQVGTSLDEVEREMIEATLAHFNGHREKTAQTLGIGVRTLQGKLRQYGYKPREKVVND
jgi:DNA-binding NtrC family response regulator